MRDMKRYTSIELQKAVRGNNRESRREWMVWLMERAGTKNGNNIGFQLWQQDNHPIALATPAIALQKLHYLHYNPVVAGFVETPEAYIYSSAVDYYTTKKGMIDIKRIDF